MTQSYGTNMLAAARRHLAAGATLMPTDRKDVAGYLFGLAAECALKHMMQDSGMRPLPREQRRDDPFYAHFEELKSIIRDRASGRRSGELRRYAESASFMQHWDISMRYSDGRAIRSEWVDRWHTDAKNVIDRI